MGQQEIPSWPFVPAKGLLQPEAAYDSVWPTATTKQNILKFET